MKYKTHQEQKSWQRNTKTKNLFDDLVAKIVSKDITVVGAIRHCKIWIRDQIGSRVLVPNEEPIRNSVTAIGTTRITNARIEITRDRHMGGGDMWSWHEFRCLGIEFEGHTVITTTNLAWFPCRFCHFLLWRGFFFYLFLRLCLRHTYFSCSLFYKSRCHSDSVFLCFFDECVWMLYVSVSLSICPWSLVTVLCHVELNPPFAPK